MIPYLRRVYQIIQGAQSWEDRQAKRPSGTMDVGKDISEETIEWISKGLKTQD